MLHIYLMCSTKLTILEDRQARVRKMGDRKTRAHGRGVAGEGEKGREPDTPVEPRPTGVRVKPTG